MDRKLVKKWIERWGLRSVWVPLLRLRFGNEQRGTSQKIFIKRKYPPEGK